MEICINNTIPNEVAYQVEYTYEPYNPMKELCDDLGIVARPVSFEFSRDRFPDTLRVSMSLGDGFSDFVKLESCFLNKTPLRTGKEFVCVLTKEDVLKSTPDKEIIQLNITLRGELEEKAQRTEETRERVLQTAKVVLGIMIGTVCFFGVLRTRIKNKVYATFRNDNLRDQILLFLVALAVIIAYCYLLIWWRGWPFVR
jgi:hypothetical protein